MVGLIVEYVLYGLLALTIMASLGAVILSDAYRRGVDVSPWFWQSMLALIAGTAPYIGLFGTVWHIIEALSGIGNGNLNVGAIAKPIGEALHATLWGLGSAILAVVMHRVAVMLVEAAPAGSTDTGA